jgi:alpha-beta hydrolase superfamily lysophospholipase
MNPTIHHEGMCAGADGAELYECCWLPEGAPRAAVLLCHGVADHCGRYPHLVARLAAAGYAVCAFDHRGHGRSAGERLHVERFSRYAEDCKIMRDRVAARYPGLPLYLFGHSMGSAVALTYLLDHPNDVAGLIASGVALYAGEGFPPIVLKLNLLLARWLPRLRLTKLPTQGVSRDEAWVAATRADPLVYHGPGTARLGAEILTALERLRPRLGEIALPLLILQGERDILVGDKGARLLYERAASADKTLRVYPGAYHEVFNDLPASREAGLDDVAAWLDARVGA